MKFNFRKILLCVGMLILSVLGLSIFKNTGKYDVYNGEKIILRGNLSYLEVYEDLLSIVVEGDLLYDKVYISIVESTFVDGDSELRVGQEVEVVLKLIISEDTFERGVAHSIQIIE